MKVKSGQIWVYKKHPNKYTDVKISGVVVLAVSNTGVVVLDLLLERRIYRDLESFTNKMEFYF